MDLRVSRLKLMRDTTGPRHCQSIEVHQSLAYKVVGFLFENSSVASSFARWAITVEVSESDGLELESFVPIDHCQRLGF